MNTRTIGQLAIVGGLLWTILFILFIPLSHGVWTGSIGILGVAGTLVATIAYSAAALGLVVRFQDRVSPLGGLGATLVVVGAATSMVGSLVAMPVGSVMLMWDLARIGVVPRPLAIVHGAAAIALGLGFVAAPLSDVDAAHRAAGMAILAPYVVTWVAIGVSLLRGGPSRPRDERLTDLLVHGATETPA
jgi:hypothetical protein